MDNVIANGRLSPCRVIVIYSDDHGFNYYLESRDVTKDANGKNRLMPPVPLTEDMMRKVAKSYNEKNTAEIGMDGLVPDHLLFCLNEIGKTVVIWYRPEMKRYLNFADKLKIKGECEVNVPATLYVSIDNRLYVFALMDSMRPDLQTKLYRAPFFNIYDDGNVCLGTAKVGKKALTFTKEAERFERAFYLAEQNGGESLNVCKTPLKALWTGLIGSKAPFPSKDELLQHKVYKTFGHLIQKLVGKNISDE